jgi:hypothetical protein
VSKEKSEWTGVGCAVAVVVGAVALVANLYLCGYVTRALFERPTIWHVVAVMAIKGVCFRSGSEDLKAARKNASAFVGHLLGHWIGVGVFTLIAWLAMSAGVVP